MAVRIVGIVFAIVILCVFAAILIGALSWRGESNRLKASLTARRFSGVNDEFADENVENLPRPVKRYLDEVMAAGRPAVRSLTIVHSGTFNMGEGNDDWKSFTSVQHVIARPPGFMWDARIRIAPGLNARVRDAYVNEEGILEAKLYGLIPVMQQSSGPELAQGELMRFLAETPWHPTSLRPHGGLKWSAIGESSARATLSDGPTTVVLEFRFGIDGYIESVYSDGRYRAVDGAQVLMPWEGRFWDYQRRDGMMIPIEGEVSWLLPDGRKTYWRGTIEEIMFEYDE